MKKIKYTHFYSIIEQLAVVETAQQGMEFTMATYLFGLGVSRATLRMD